MKKAFLLVSLVLAFTITNAKKVKFSVNLTGQIVSTYGVHISGDFQTIAGYAGGDWASNTTIMTKETYDTNIFSVIVDIPAFRKYEFKYLNGDQWYDVEFVPLESRVGYNFNDSRWIYVDSLSNDTTTTGAILYSGNAPTGLTLVRFIVDMQSESAISAKGVHVAGNFQSWSPTKTILYNLDTTSKNYEIICFLNAGVYEYKYYNGNTISTAETVPTTCATNGSRYLNVVNDTVFSTLCFASCNACSGVGIINNKISDNNIRLYPNPTSEYSTLELNDREGLYNIKIINQRGQIVRDYKDVKGGSFKINKDNLSKGIYTISIINNKNLKPSFVKLIII